RLLAALDEGGFAPPDLLALARSHGASRALLDALAVAGELVRITPSFGLTPAGYSRWRQAVGEAFAASDQVTVKQLRDQLGTSRKYVLAFLEHLDARAVTRRVGEARILLDRSWLPE
ncbi:MAG: SelB C-terminal domain-containing protein, partial [Chloroflexi bacterium]|nr:SelB C-terminal domain-containing protein [Chloroflexota bacterium]